MVVLVFDKKHKQCFLLSRKVTWGRSPH